MKMFALLMAIVTGLASEPTAAEESIRFDFASLSMKP